jgi:hypothetical protein
MFQQILDAANELDLERLREQIREVILEQHDVPFLARAGAVAFLTWLSDERLTQLVATARVFVEILSAVEPGRLEEICSAPDVPAEVSHALLDYARKRPVDHDRE